MFKKLYSVWILAGLLILMIGVLFYFLQNKPNPSTIVPEQKSTEKLEQVNDYGGAYLDTIGQKLHQKDFGTMKLLQLYPIHKTFMMDSMAITIDGLKLIELSDMTDDTKAFLTEYTGLSFDEVAELHYNENLSVEEIDELAAYSKIEIGNKLTFFELTYTVQNKAPKEMQFFSFKHMKFNEDLSFIVPNQNFLASGDSLVGTSGVSTVDYKPNEKRSGIIGLINDSGETIKQLKSFSFSTTDLADGKTHELISKAQTFTVPLTK